jgi:transposase InsO family protein
LEESPEKRHGYKPKPYQRGEYPGQKVQVDVKFVPAYCVANGQKYYQYTAVDECTRYCFREMYDEHSTYSSLDFLKKLIEYFPFPIREIQTDNGTEWTNALLVKNAVHKTLFEQYLEDNDIVYHRIRVATPRHNGKVERQHRLDGKRFYSKMRMYSLADGRKQLSRYNKLSNKISKCCLNYRSPVAVLETYLAVM